MLEWVKDCALATAQHGPFGKKMILDRHGEPTGEVWLARDQAGFDAAIAKANATLDRRMR
jgi:hypothetical protein